MYQKYHTEALVLGSSEQGEHDRIFTLYTKDFGLLRARASAVRTEASRMRYALQNYSRTYVTLVRGKRGWRIGGSLAMKGALGSTENISAFARIVRLITRLVAGEEQNVYLFATLSSAHDVLMSFREQVSEGSSAIVELVCVARILYALGYLSSEALQTALFTHTAYTGEYLLEAEMLRDQLLSHVNRAIAETHL